MKRILGIILTLCILFACGTHTVSANDNSVTQDNKVKLSTLTQEQCIQFLLECGITIPDGYENVGFPALFAEIEENPHMSIAFNDVIFSAFCEEIKAAVNAHYGVPETTNAGQGRYTLQDSDIYAWDSYTMTNYNCYSFVLGFITQGYNPGHFSNGTYDNTQIIEVIANLVEYDLTSDALGYECVKRLHDLPTSTSGWENVIAVRKDINHFYFNDYHFAMLTSVGWLHKPSTTAVLKFKTAPSNSYPWTNECYNGYYYSPTITYESDVIYFKYKTNHGNLTETWLGDHYHMGDKHVYVYRVICDDCGRQVKTVIKKVSCSGPPCLVPVPGEIKKGEF